MPAAAKSNNTLVVLGLLAGGGYLLYEGVIKPGIVAPVKLKTYTANLRVNLPTVRFKGDNVEFDLYVQNVNDYPITIKAVVGDVYVINKGGAPNKIGNVDRYGSTVLKPTAETKYTFSVRLKLINLVALFNSIFAGKVSGMSLMFNGNININGRVWAIKEVVKISA